MDRAIIIALLVIVVVFFLLKPEEKQQVVDEYNGTENVDLRDYIIEVLN